MLLQKLNTIKKEEVNKNIKQINFDAGNNESGEYKVKAIQHNAAIKKSQNQIVYQISTI